MKITSIAISVFVIGLATGCSDEKREAQKTKADAEAKLRAEAARKEMETLPKAFSTPDYYKKNEPAQPLAPSGSERSNPKKQ